MASCRANASRRGFSERDIEDNLLHLPDDDRPALIRVTTTRSGARMVTLTEVDFTDDKVETWLVRNRTTLDRVGQ